MRYLDHRRIGGRSPKLYSTGDTKVCFRRGRSSTAISNHYFLWQSTSTLLVTPLVTTTGPEAWHSAVPPSYCGLCPVTVYVPTGTGTANRPFAPTVMAVMCPLDPWRVICPLRARGPAPEGPPTAWSVPVSVPVGPGGPLGDERSQLANNTEAAVIASRASKVRDFRRTAYPPLCSCPTCSNESVGEARPAVTATHYGDISLIHVVST